MYFKLLLPTKNPTVLNESSFISASPQKNSLIFGLSELDGDVILIELRLLKKQLHVLNHLKHNSIFIHNHSQRKGLK